MIDRRITFLRAASGAQHFQDPLVTTTGGRKLGENFRFHLMEDAPRQDT
jgi:hypothetical protein